MALALVLALAAPALGKDFVSHGIVVRDPWTRPAAKGGVGAGFAAVLNTGPRAVRLVSLSSPNGARVELHQTVSANGVYSMKSFPDGVVIPPGGRLELAPEGFHAMVVGLKEKLMVGGDLPVIFVFRQGNTTFAIHAVLPVRNQAPK